MFQWNGVFPLGRIWNCNQRQICSVAFPINSLTKSSWKITEPVRHASQSNCIICKQENDFGLKTKNNIIRSWKRHFFWPIHVYVTRLKYESRRDRLVTLTWSPFGGGSWRTRSFIRDTLAINAATASWCVAFLMSLPFTYEKAWIKLHEGKKHCSDEIH